MVVLFLPSSNVDQILCTATQYQQTSKRFIWILVTKGGMMDKTDVLTCTGPEVGTVLWFDVDTTLPSSQVCSM